MNLLSMSCEKVNFRDIRETEVESELIAESEHLFMDVFAEVLNSQSENLPRCDVHNMSINVPLMNVLPAKVCLSCLVCHKDTYKCLLCVFFFVISTVFSGSWKG